jgi:hypothetical protein
MARPFTIRRLTVYGEGPTKIQPGLDDRIRNRIRRRISIYAEGERVVRDSDGLAGEWAGGDSRAGCGHEGKVAD